MVFGLEDDSWLGDHKVQQDVVFAIEGEAIREITFFEAGYCVRHVVAYTAIILGDSKPVELVTRLRHRKLAHSIDSEFHDFVMSSFSGSVWITNCEGRVRANENLITGATCPQSLPRHVPV